MPGPGSGDATWLQILIDDMVSFITRSHLDIRNGGAVLPTTSNDPPMAL